MCRVALEWRGRETNQDVGQRCPYLEEEQWEWTACKDILDVKICECDGGGSKMQGCYDEFEPMRSELRIILHTYTDCYAV